MVSHSVKLNESFTSSKCRSPSSTASCKSDKTAKTMGQKGNSKTWNCFLFRNNFHRTPNSKKQLPTSVAASKHVQHEPFLFAQQILPIRITCCCDWQQLAESANCPGLFHVQTDFPSCLLLYFPHFQLCLIILLGELDCVKQTHCGSPPVLQGWWRFFSTSSPPGKNASTGKSRGFKWVQI